LVGAEGVEPVIDWLRASYSAVELRSRELVPPVGIEPIVGRLSSGCSAVELRGHGGKVGFDPLPIQDRFYRPTAGATGFPSRSPRSGMIRDRRLTKAVHCRCATRAEMADSPGHDPDTLSGTHCLAGRPGNRTGCAVPGGRRRNRTPDLAITLVFRTSRQPSSGAFQNWYPGSDSN
jgi:hypothetical protein